MANNTTKTYREFRKSAQARLQAANAVLTKQASFNATDPNCQGTVAIPDCGDGSNREKLNLPRNMTNYGDPDKMHNLCKVTKPNGTGQGDYMIPRNGSARDAAINSFTAPMDKLADAATSLRNVAASLRQQADAQDVQMGYADMNSEGILSKLAGLGALALEHEEGRRAMQNILEKEAGIREAQNIIYNTQAMMNNYVDTQSAEMQKIASVSLSHQAWLDQFGTELEKRAYAQGALDGEQAAQSMESGVDPAATDVPPGLTEEDVLGTLQQLVQSGQIDDATLQALLGGVQQAGADGSVTDDEIAGLLTQAVQNGELAPEQAQAIAAAVLQTSGGGGGVPEQAAADPGAMAPGGPVPADPGMGAPAGPAPVDPAVAKAASFHMQNAANIINRFA